MYVRFDLHAKTYIVDNKRGLVGSANVTNSGFNLGKSGNMEMAAFVDIEEKDIKKIANLFKDAVPVTEDLLEKMKKQLEGINANKTKEENRWDDSIRSLFNPQIETLFSYELPESFELKKGEYFAFLDEEYDGNKENLKNIFRWSNSYLWLLGTLQKNKGCIDKSLLEYPRHREPDEKEDNIRIYVPMDLNKDAILRRLDNIIGLYGEAREDNEIEFSIDVGMIISQLEIYDQIWFVRHMPKKGEHSREAKELVTEIIARLEDIPDGCAECFPFELIDELKQEYLTDNSL